MKVKMTGKNQFVGSLTFLGLTTDETEEAESYHNENKNIASVMLIFSDSLFARNWRDGW